MTKSIAVKISVVILTMVALSILATGAVGYMIYRGDAVEQGSTRALDIAKSAAAAIDPAAMRQIMATMEENEDWRSIKTVMDKIKVDTGVKYLYVLNATPNADNQMVYFVEGYDYTNDQEDELTLGDTEDISYYDDELGETVDVYDEQLFVALETGQPQFSQVYQSGEFGRMVSGFAPVMDDSSVVGVVGVDISVEDVMAAANQFALRLFPIMLFACILFGAISVWLINRMVGRPIRFLTNASDEMAEGIVDLQVDVRTEDEIGMLADSFRRMMDNTRTQVDMLEQLAEGELNIRPMIRNDKDAMNIAISKMVDQLDSMFRDILGSSEQVSAAASQISSAAQSLADSSSNQSAILTEFTAAISGLHEQSSRNAGQSSGAVEKMKDASSLMTQSTQLMDEMCRSMDAINESSERISKVIHVIDDIAFQTNILALNAAVEAARAGQHGKGFAVVADEVRNLAAKSAAAAQETATLIEGSADRVGEGSRIASTTGESLRSADSISLENTKILEDINASSLQQSVSIAEINQRINQISADVQQSSAAAQQSAAAAQQMFSQAQELERIVSRFHLRTA